MSTLTVFPQRSRELLRAAVERHGVAAVAERCGVLVDAVQRAVDGDSMRLASVLAIQAALDHMAPPRKQP